MTTITTETKSAAGIEKGDRVRLIDAGGDGSSDAQVGDLGTVTEVGAGFDRDLITVEFDKGGISCRCDYRFEVVTTVTVEDREGLDALPIGTVLRVGYSKNTTIRKATDTRYPWATGNLADNLNYGAHVSQITDPGWLPALVENPEILGEFAPVPDPLADWEKDLLGIFEEGEVVEIIGHPDDDADGIAEKWAGLRGVVERDNNGSDVTLIRPLTSRPDRFELGVFYWDTPDLLRMEKPFAIGDRVRIGDEAPQDEVGWEGFIVADLTEDAGDDYLVAVEAEGGLELTYRKEHVELVASARQVEIAKAKEEQARIEAEAARFTEGTFVRIVGNSHENPAGPHHFEVGSTGTVEGYCDGSVRVLAFAPSFEGVYPQALLPVDVEVITKDEFYADKPLAVGDQVEAMSQLDALPRGSVVYFTTDPASPLTKTGYDGNWNRMNRYLDRVEDKPNRPVTATVYTQTEKLRRRIEKGLSEVIVAYVPA